MTVTKLELAGKRFGSWVALERTSRKSFSSFLWKCKCDCGVVRDVSGASLKAGHSKSCGCLTRLRNIERSTTHGMCKHPLYSTWVSMRKRCHGKATKSNASYIRKGITVCTEWKEGPTKFISWAENHGWAAGLQLDRKKNHLGYSPDNCRFVTPQVNANNKDKAESLSGFTGVYFHGSKKTNQWAASIYDKGKTRWSAYFATKGEAALARHQRLKKSFPWKQTDPAIGGN